MNELEKELVTGVTNNIVPRIIEYYKAKEIGSNYFELIGLSREIYQKWNYDLNINLCEDLKKVGLTRTPLAFEEVSVALKNGKEKGEFLLSLAKDGRKLIDKAMGKERILN